MKWNLLTTIFLPFLLIHPDKNPFLTDFTPLPASQINSMPARVGDIALPPGYERVPATTGSFAAWLRSVGIKKDKTVYLYNGQPKQNQDAQYVVLNIPLGHKDLQQCADAVMRLRAQYFYSQKRFAEIWFKDNNGKKYTCTVGVDSLHFQRYLENVFAWCGTLSLEKQLHPVTNFLAIQPGDVLIKGGSPGHAVIVMDVAVNKAGKKIYLLAQSYMPAQDMHILKNPADGGLSPWYEAKADNSLITTPEWTFSPNQLRRW
jgi:hypothetical protein